MAVEILEGRHDVQAPAQGAGLIGRDLEEWEHGEFHGVFEELVDQDRVLVAGRPRFLEVPPQSIVVADDTQDPSAKNVTGPYRHRVADLGCLGQFPGR